MQKRKYLGKGEEEELPVREFDSRERLLLGEVVVLQPLLVSVVTGLQATVIRNVLTLKKMENNRHHDTWRKNYPKLFFGCDFFYLASGGR